MKKRILSLLLAALTLVGMLAVPTGAAGTLEEAMAEVNVYAKNAPLTWLTMNGAVKEQHYTYYNYTSVLDGSTKEIPAYCVDPKLYGVPALVPEGTAIKYSAESTVSDPKVCGILGNGYPHEPLSTLKVNTVEEAYYATKTALWIYLLGDWSINGLGINPSLSGADREAAERVLAATKWIYSRGMGWTELHSPKLTAVADSDTAYPVTINGEACYQQIFTIESDTWCQEPVKLSLAAGAPAGTVIMDMDDKEITSIVMPINRPYKAQVKVVYPASDIEGQSGTVQLNISCVVVNYAIYYAKSLEVDKYGNIQDYMLDTDPNIPAAISATSRYSGDEPGTPDEPDEPDTPEDGGLLIRKYETGTNDPLEGAVFEVIGPDGDVVGSYSTNGRGIIELSGLKPGNYTVTELTPPRFHRLPERTTQNVTVPEGGVAELTYWNDPYGNLRVEKLSDTGDPLEGVTIQIKNLVTNETQTGQTGPGGAIEFTRLAPGGYEVRELAGITGWIADTDTVKTVTIVTGQTSTVTFTNKEAPGLRIIKYDRSSHQRMAGVMFAVYRDGQFLGNYPTDAMGELLIPNAQPGTYRVFEVDTGDDGHILDTTPQEIELKAGDGIKELVFFNDMKPGIHLVKVDSSNLSKPIANVKFRIEAVDHSFGPEEFTTDENGEIDLSKLPTGAYVVTELECPGYVIDEAQRIIQLNANETAHFVFTNSKLPSAQLVKLSSDGTALAGVSFRLAKIEDGSHYLDRTTDENGEILWEGLEPGVYSLKELATRDDHIIDPQEHHIELFPGKTSTIVLENDKRPNLTIVKRDADTGEPVPGTVFEVRFADGHSVQEVRTGTDGSATIENLLPGVYEITEKSVPEGYLLDAESQLATLYPNRDHTVYFHNHKRPTLKISKIDINGNLLPGAIFEVKTKEGVKIGDFPVGPDGTVTIPNTQLNEGYYIIAEKQAPEGYILDPTPHEVYLRPGKTTEISIENEKKPGLTIYKIDSVVGDGIKGAKFKIYVAKDNTQNGTYQELDSSFYYTDENGIIHLENLDTGWYKIVEVEPASGFSMKEPHEQIIYVEHDKAVEVTFENTPLNAIIVEKYDSVTGAALQGATFQLRYLGGTSGTGGTVIGQKVTSKNGTAMWTGLKPGTYILEEVDPANGYNIIQSSETIFLADSGEQSVVTVRFKNAPDGILLIRKVCAVNPSTTLQDAEFKVTYADGTLIGDSNGIFTTDENGEIRIEGLTPGKSVIVTETRAPAGFIIDTQSQTVQIKEGRTVSLTFKNQPKGSLIIQKRDSVTGQPITGAQFRVTTAAGCEVGLDGVIGSSTLTQNGIFTTDSNGEIRISNLAPGTYVLTEIKAPAGYVMDAPSTNVVIGANGDTQTVIVTNTPKGNLIVEKYDSVTKQPLAGARFKIMYANGELVADNEGATSSNGLYTTDINGQIILSKVNPGTLVVTENLAPDNYRLDPTPQTVVVNAGDTQTLRFYDDPLCTLTILKRDAVTQKPLAGAEFTVRDSEGRLLGPDNGLYVTGTDGTVTVTGLAPNSTVVVSESKAPSGYIKDETPKNIVVRSGATNTLIFDDQPTTTLIIHKYIEGTENEPLSGVAFKVVDGSGAAVGPDDGIYYTDKAGDITLDGLEPGTTVIVREVKTVEGFVLDGTPQDILIEAGKVQQLTFWNKRAGSLVIQKKDSVTGEPLPGVEFEITDANGQFVADENGHLSSNGLYVTDRNGEIRINGVVGTLVVRETKTIDGYLIDPAASTQTVTVYPDDTQTLVFYNDPMGGLLIKKMDAVTREPLADVTFKVIRPDGTVIGTSNGEFRTDKNGYISIPDLVGTIIVQEVKAKDGYLLDDTTKSIEIKDHQLYTLEFFNKPLGSLIIEKLDSVTRQPLEGVEFELRYADGSYVDNGKLSSLGRYFTDSNGQIIISGITGTVIATEVKSIPGYTIHEETRSQTVVINPNDIQKLIFYNDPIGGVEIIKVNSSDKTERIPNVTFEIRKMDDALVDTVTTDMNGRVFLSLEDGAYYAVEIECPKDFKLDSTPHYFEVKDGKTVQVKVKNSPFSGILIHKVDAITKQGIYGVTFLLYDSSNNPIGQYTSDDHGYVYIEDLPQSGRYYLRELEVQGYILDTQLKTVYVTAGETTLVEWENIPITGQIQITKTSADYNTMNGWPAGTPIPDTEFEIYNKVGNLVDTIKTDSNGVARSRALPLGRYTIVESKSAEFYGLDKTPIEVEIEFSGQIVRAAMTNKSLYTNVSIRKTGYVEVMPGQTIRYDFADIANNSTTSLTSFYWRDTLPAQVRLQKIYTGTYNVPGNYKVVYQTNLSNGTWRTLNDNLSTSRNYVLDASPAALGLAANEYVTQFMFSFGAVPANFRQVETPRVDCTVLSTLNGGTQFVNQADVGGVYDGQWIMSTSRWVTRVYKPATPLPRTGY